MSAADTAHALCKDMLSRIRNNGVAHGGLRKAAKATGIVTAPDETLERFMERKLKEVKR
ncbi:hypothetical protein K0U83_07040 [bacterium]|nr:hypothetical protein [bacterium]